MRSHVLALLDPRPCTSSTHDALETCEHLWIQMCVILIQMWIAFVSSSTFCHFRCAPIWSVDVPTLLALKQRMTKWQSPPYQERHDMEWRSFCYSALSAKHLHRKYVIWHVPAILFCPLCAESFAANFFFFAVEAWWLSDVGRDIMGRTILNCLPLCNLVTGAAPDRSAAQVTARLRSFWRSQLETYACGQANCMLEIANYYLLDMTPSVRQEVMLFMSCCAVWYLKFRCAWVQLLSTNTGAKLRPEWVVRTRKKL